MTNAQQLLEEREKRFNDAVALKKPDRVPIAVLWDYFPARRKGISVKTAMYDHQIMFDAWVDCMQHFAPDLMENPFASYGLGRLLDALDYQQFIWAGHGLSDGLSWQFVELELMKADEYDHFIFDPSDFMVRRYWPRVSKAVAGLETLPPLNQVIPYSWGLHAGVSLLSAQMEAARNAMIEAAEASATVLKWHGEFHKKATELGFPALAGGKAQVPFDTLGDLFRGTKGIMMDLYRRPDKVMAACDKLLPIMIDVSVASAKRSGIPRIFIPLHKGLDSFLSPKHFDKFYWPHMKELLEALIRENITPWVLAEGVCNQRLKAFRDVPPGKVVYHFEATDIFKAKELLRDRCCIRGNVPLSILTVGRPEEVRAYCKKLIDVCGADGGFIMDASTVLGDARPENVQAMFDTTKEYGVYG